MFCTELRRRASFSSVVPALISTEGLKLRELNLATHDVAIPLDAAKPRLGSHTAPDRQLRLLLLSPSSVSDAKLEGTLDRIRHFASLTGGQDIAIVFLLEAPAPTSFVSAKQLDAAETGSTGMLAYTQLQATTVDLSGSIPYIRIIPVATRASLPDQLKKYVANITRPRRVATQPPPSPFTLLQHCTTSPPMPQQTAYYLSDLFPNLRELAMACSTVTSAPGSSSPSVRAAATQSMLSSQDQMMAELANTDGIPFASQSNAHTKLKQLRDLVGEQQCRAIVDFWQEEYVMD